MTADTEGDTTVPLLQLVLCAVEAPLAAAWSTVAEGRKGVRVHEGSVLDIEAEAVVSPANSFGWMRSGVDALYSRAFPNVEQHVRSGVLAYHG
ncbi:MAG: phage tail protein, partial [Kutzneria sp.]|nr:phage tail protein [Kutzneria sp.]